MTWLPTGADELVDGPVGELLLDLLLEQPAIPATTVAAAAMPTKIPDFATGLLRLVALELRRIVDKCVREEGPLPAHPGCTHGLPCDRDLTPREAAEE